MQINLDTNQSGLGRVSLATLLPPALQCGFDTVTFPPARGKCSTVPAHADVPARSHDRRAAATKQA